MKVTLPVICLCPSASEHVGRASERALVVASFVPSPFSLSLPGLHSVRNSARVRVAALLSCVESSELSGAYSASVCTSTRGEDETQGTELKHFICQPL